jgi:hypothetical protein
MMMMTTMMMIVGVDAGIGAIGRAIDAIATGGTSIGVGARMTMRATIEQRELSRAGHSL